jgi:hypothetical protein
MLAVGCYAAPDYSGTHFKCDSTHACPEGQQCVNGTCSGGSSIDASGSSAGVLCGATTCAATQKCCADLSAGVPTCIALTASCTGFAATCDGKEDCGTMKCCESGTLLIGCVATCAGQGRLICRDNTDCTDATQPNCCASVGTLEPWGRCNAVCP